MVVYSSSACGRFGRETARYYPDCNDDLRWYDISLGLFLTCAATWLFSPARPASDKQADGIGITTVDVEPPTPPTGDGDCLSSHNDVIPK